MECLKDFLVCPFCVAKLRLLWVQDGYGVLACSCSRFPIVAGIPVIKKGAIGVDGRTADEVIGLIEAGRHREALLSMVTPPLPFKPVMLPTWIRSLTSVKGIRRLKRLARRQILRWQARQDMPHGWQEQAEALLTDRDSQVKACNLFDIYFRRSGWPEKVSYDYFAFRYGQPRHLVGLAYASLIRDPKKPVLDLACGAGLLTPTLVRRAAGQPVVGLDNFFFLLYVAKHWIAPETEYVCCLADATLPFSDDAFSAVFCSDAFFYFVNKARCVRELKRLSGTDGVILLVWLKNALHQHLHPGRPLSPREYQALVADMPHRLVVDTEVLARYLRKQGPALAAQVDHERLAQAPVLSIVASHRDGFFQDYGPFEEWPHAEGRLELNPLYVEEGEDEFGHIRLRRMFPSAFYEEENAECKAYLPDMVRLQPETLDALHRGQRTADVKRLIEQFVVLGIPERH